MMKRLFKLIEGFNDCVIEVEMMRDVWGRSPRVTFDGSPHHAVEDIILRGPEPGPLNEMWSAIECEDYPVARHFPNCMAQARLLQMMRNRETWHPQLGRVILTKLPPGEQIDWHRDEGPVPEFYSRFHLCLAGGAGNIFTVNQEVKAMRPGEVWEIDVRNEHGVMNMETHDRIHLIVDVERPATRRVA